MEGQPPSACVPHASAPLQDTNIVPFICVFPEGFYANPHLGIFPHMNDNSLYILCCRCIIFPLHLKKKTKQFIYLV